VYCTGITEALLYCRYLARRDVGRNLYLALMRCVEPIDVAA
jgi:hypothetical protein